MFGGLIVAIFVYLLYTRFQILNCLSFLVSSVENALYRLYGCGGNYCRLFIAVAVDTGTKGLASLSTLVTSGHNANFAALFTPLANVR